VSKESACLDGAFCEGLAANHMGMNKFTGDDDYILVYKQLDIICKEANAIVQARFECKALVLIYSGFSTILNHCFMILI
jgi:hypothetical protein